MLDQWVEVLDYMSADAVQRAGDLAFLFYRQGALPGGR